MTLPPLIATYAVLVYLSEKETPVAKSSKTEWTSLNLIAKNGSNGSLVVSTGSEATTSFKQVLDMGHATDKTSILKALSIPHLVLTTSIDICATLANAATVECAPPHALASRVLAFIASSKRSIVVLHLDLSEMNVSLSTNVDSTCFVGIVKESTSRPPAHNPTDIPFPVPPQSWLKRNGQYETLSAASWLVYSFYLRHQSRQDTVATFNDAAIFSLGGYSSMQAHVALREISFRLGHVAKYGA
ncbi:hypothetical protein, variant [Aphanomyces astaci]|uniref:Uncharacterized protein n=1 Tax=Aphanomyces astaci TaxID=112090 RepID=W4GUJ1_APHAT|nr:hypothetical protein, variant [Aphanomyces astaci]ETV82679.1 hypothetical protein, variant [Aphanomyces astaci]|eukprot:XP_009828348.1 hypothetical protein, variant [Aphanomyces astaci]